MSGEDFFKFNKGGEFRFSNFKEIREEDLKEADEKTKKLFNVFAGEDKILQAGEAQSLWNALMSAAQKNVSGENNLIDGKEIQLFSQEYINEEIDANTFEQLIKDIFAPKNSSTNTTTQKTEVKKYTSNNGAKIEDTITYNSENKPVKLVRKENGIEISTTEFNYVAETDDTFAYVKLVTQNTDGSTVVTTALDTDANGQVASDKLIDRTTTDNTGNITKVYSENGYIVEQNQKTDGKEVLTIYKGSGIEDYDNNSLHRAFQQTTSKNGKVNVVEYDEKGNTKTIVQNGESLELIAQKFGIKLTDLKETNPKLVKRMLQVGEEILIPGEFNADSLPIRTRKTKEEAIQSYNNFAVKQSIKRIYASNISEKQLDKNYSNMYDLAKAILAEQGNTSLTKEQINDYANELILLNKDAKLTKGAKIKYTSGRADEKTIHVLSEAGFLPNEENQIFYAKFNSLDEYQKNNVLNVVKYCKSKNITDPDQIKATIIQTYPEINMFDSGKIINTTGIGQLDTRPTFQRTPNKQIPVEMFITDVLKLDLNSGVGKQVYSRLVQLPQSELDKISADNFLGLENPTFDQIADRCGFVNIRTENELETLQNSPKYQQQRFRQAAAENVALAYNNAIEVIKNYQGNQGWLNVGFYREKLGSLLSKINPTDVATCFEDVVKRLEEERDLAVSYLKSKSGNEAEFKRTFKEITGVEYNEKDIQNFIDIASKEGADWSDAYNKAYGDKIVENATKKVNFQSYVDGAGDIVLMLLGTEAIGKGVAQVGSKVGSKLTPYIPKTLSNIGNTTVLKIGANPVTVGKITGAMATSSATFTLWDSSKNYINLKTKEIQYTGEQAEQEWEMYKEGNIESAKFGAAAGLLNSTVVGKVVNFTMKTFEKPVLKATQKVSKLFEKNSTVSGTDLMKTYLANQKPGFLAQSAGVLAEVSGFTLYETANEVAKELMVTDENGERHLPKELTEEGLTSFLWERFKGQASMLGEIKAISKLIFMHRGAANIRNQMMEESLSKCETVNNLNIKKSEINGREVFEIKYADGTREIANSIDEAIAKCHVIMQFDMIMNTKENVDKVGDQKGSNDAISGLKGENIAENSLLEKAAKENPVWVAEGKIKDKWLSQGLEETDTEVTATPIIIENGKATLDIKTIKEYNQNYKSEPIDEVSKLIFSGKLNETLTKRYEEMGKVFEELGQKYNTKFNELAVKYKDDSAKYTEEVIKILSKEFGMEGFEIPVEFISGNGKTCYFDYTKGKILMDRSITDAKDFTTLLVHEFKHLLQFRDLTSQYGIEGVIDIIVNDKSIEPDKRNESLNQTLNNSYNKRLLTEYDFATIQKGSVSDYLNRIYKDEFTDTKTTYPEYIEKQITEPEAYYSANGKFANNIDLEGRNITKPYTEQEISELKAKGKIYETSTGNLFLILGDGNIEILNTNIPKGSSGISGIDETAQKTSINHNESKSEIALPQGKLNSGDAINKKNDNNTTSIGFLTKIKNSVKIESYMKNKLSRDLKDATSDAKQEVKYFLNKVLEKNPDIDLKENKDLLKFAGTILEIKKIKPDVNTNELANAISKLFVTCNDGKYTLSNLNSMLRGFLWDENTKVETGLELFKSISDSGLSRSQIESLFKINNYGDAVGILDNFQEWNSLINIMPYLRDLDSPNLIHILDIIKQANNGNIRSNTASYNKSILNSLEKLPNDLKQHFIENGIFVNKLEDKLRTFTMIKGHDVVVDKESQDKFLKSIIANNNQKAENVIKSDDFQDFIQKYSSSGLPLKYSRNTFIKELNNLLSELTESDKNKVLKDLGINLTNDNFNGFIHYANLNTENYSPNISDIITKIKDCSEKFVHKNEIQCDNSEIKVVLDDLIQGFPEFTSIIGKQNGTDTNTLDMHILEVLHNAENHPNYARMSDSQKTILKFSILTHDLAKLSNDSDMGEIAIKSSILSSSILDKFNMSQDTKERIVNIVAHHPKHLNKYIQLKEDLDIVKTMTQADTKAEFGNGINTDNYSIGRGGNNYLPITRCQVKYENYSKYQRNINGKTYECRVESLDDIPLDADMSKYGFFGIKKEDVIIQTHSIETIAELKNVTKNYDDPTYYMALSTSVRKLTDSDNGYGKYTLVLATSKMNRGGGDLYWKLNGYGKDIDNFNNLNEWPRLRIRPPKGCPQEVADYVASLEYPNRIKDIEINGKHYTKEELTNIWKMITDEITSSKINEVLAANPKVQQIIVHNCKSEAELPNELIILASEYKIPIFIEK